MTCEEIDLLIVAGAAQDCRSRDLVAVEVQNRQNGAVTGRIEEGDPLPRAFERPCLCLAIADDCGDDQIRLSNAAPKAWDKT